MNEDLLPEIGRVTWIAARLQFTIRDATNRLEGKVSDAPFHRTLGDANTDLETLAKTQSRANIVDWCATARLAIRRRNGLVHAVAKTLDGRQVLGGSTPERPNEYTQAEIQSIADALADAALSIPRS